MFGTYRTFLALIVVVHHLISIPIIGHYAVHGFFILSGYLMTFVMNVSYGYSLRGIRAFSINRFLRLYPSYWVVLLLTLLSVAFFGESNAIKYREFIFFSNSMQSILQNVSLLYIDLFPTNVSPRLSPPTWALTIEIIFYILIALGISRSKRITTVWFFLSILYMALTHVLDLGYSFRYNIIFAGTLPFSMGAMIYHYYNALEKLLLKSIPDHAIAILFFVFILNSGLAIYGNEVNIPNSIQSFFFYVNYLVNALIIIKLVDGKIPYLSKKDDYLIGLYSYPVYLAHWQAGFVASMIIWGEPVRGWNVQGGVSLLLAMVICFILSLLIIRYVDTPIERFRKRIKQNIDNVTAN
ncbi:TPA: acyltransferase family protein [Aeromonas veronii]